MYQTLSRVKIEKSVQNHMKNNNIFKKINSTRFDKFQNFKM